MLLVLDGKGHTFTIMELQISDIFYLSGMPCGERR